MSKAEERALEKYPLMADDDKEGLEALKYIGMECDCASEYNEVQEAKQAYFIEGYHQAEKDLELTWEDVKMLQDISSTVYSEVAQGSVDYYQIYPTEQSFLEEVLKRFKERKEK